MSGYDAIETTEVPATITVGNTESAEVNLRGKRVVGAFIPAGFEGANLTFIFVDDAGVDHTVYHKGVDYSEQVSPLKYVDFDPTITLGGRVMKIISDVAVAGVDKAVNLVTREV